MTENYSAICQQLKPTICGFPTTEIMLPWRQMAVEGCLTKQFWKRRVHETSVNNFCGILMMVY
jgi:hypothetical protein